MFRKLFMSESKRIIKTPVFFIIAGLLVVFTIVFCIVAATNDESENSENAVYGVTEYATFDELAEKLDNAEKSLTEKQDALERDIEIKAVTKEQIARRREDIRFESRTVNVMRVLIEKQIPFKDAAQYNTSSAHSISIMNHCFVIGAIFIGLAAIVRLSVAMPGEVKEGQAKLMLTMPVTRTKYALFKVSLAFLQSAILLFGYVVFAIIIAAIFFGVSGVLVFANSETAFTLGIIPAALLQMSFAVVSLIGYHLIAFTLSLLTLNKIATLLISLPICFGGILIEFIESAFTRQPVFSRVFISSNLTIQKVFENPSANPVWLAGIVLFAYLAVLTVASFSKFKRQDVLN